MHFAFTDEQEELRRTVRRMLTDRTPPPPATPDQPERTHDPVLWSRLAEQLGAHALAIPEEHGGFGFSLVETGIVLEELGRELVALPLLSSAVLGAQALLTSADTAACARIVPAIADGSAIATLAWAEPSTHWDPDTAATTARRVNGQWLLDGEKSFVLDGTHADVLLVAAHAPGGMSLFELDDPAAVQAETAMDRTRDLVTIPLDSSPAQLIGVEGAAATVLHRVRDVACAALAVEQAGAAARCLTDTVEHVRERTQFGRTIGSFQAVKHRLADRYVELESARSAAYAAMWAVATQAPEASHWAAGAKSFCSEAYREIAAEGIQLHGGIGITWEHSAHRHLKRAHSAEHLFGTPRHHRERLAADLGIID